MKKSQIAFALFIAAMGAFSGVEAQEGIPAAPFGVEMGKTDSCNTLNKKLLSLSAKVRREPARDDATGVEIPGIWKFSPANVLFPDAISLTAVCRDNRLKTLWLSVSNGIADKALIDTLAGLRSKYGNENAAYSDPRKGVHMYTPSKFSSINVEAHKNGKAFSLTYEFHGSLDDSVVEQEAKDRDASKARKLAL